MNHIDMLNILIRKADPKKAEASLRFFKTGKGEYAEGDKFLGFTVPEVRSLAKKYGKELAFADLEELLKSEWHEARTFALVVMKGIISKKDGDKELKRVYEAFLRNVEHINNWDLVDIFSPYITGAYWYKNSGSSLLWEFANSGNLWKERIAVLSSFYNMRLRKETGLTFELAEHFLRHPHDLIHKAVGWSLREAGKIDENALLSFLDRYASVMPRTMLRYSLERLDIDKRKHYMRAAG
jgi:3-methyladenine DNA glycosylase AlkD